MVFMVGAEEEIRVAADDEEEADMIRRKSF